MRPSGIITLLTDFGLKDAYVGVMKGVMLSINRNAHLVDISHQVAHGSIAEASELLLESFPFFPQGTVHLVVVDPGVGSGRRPIALRAENHLFVGPDNGVFWPIVNRGPDVEIIHLTEERYFLERVSRTFHGRDLFAPVAAHLSCGLELSKAGKPIEDPVSLPTTSPQFDGRRIKGKVVRVDHFGNLITDIAERDLRRFPDPDRVRVEAGNLRLKGVKKTYSDVKEGEALALIGSAGRLEIGVNLGRACDRLEKGSGGSALGTEVEASEDPSD